MIKTAIGGELVRWNATRFGTNYLFLESFMQRKERFMQWMTSSELILSRYMSSKQGRYAHDCLSSLGWWNNVRIIVDSVQSLYAFLCFADQDKIPILSEVLLRYNVLKSEYDSMFQIDRISYNKYMACINRRMSDITARTYVNVVAALNPRTHYQCTTGPTLFEDLRLAFERMTDTNIVAEALMEADIYHNKSLSFSGRLAYRMACDSRTSLA